MRIRVGARRSAQWGRLFQRPVEKTRFRLHGAPVCFTITGMPSIRPLVPAPARSSFTERVRRHLAASAYVVAGLAISRPASGEVIPWYCNLELPATYYGLYFNVEARTSSPNVQQVPGWDLNVWHETDLYFFLPAGSGVMRFPGVNSGGAGSLSVGTSVGPEGTYGANGAVVFGSNTGNWRLNSVNYFGFRFVASDGLLRFGFGAIQVGATASIRRLLAVSYESTPGLPITITEFLVDADNDGVPFQLDNCPWHPNLDQADCDANGVGDVCEVTLNHTTGNMGAFGSGVTASGVIAGARVAATNVEVRVQCVADLDAVSEYAVLKFGGVPVGGNLWECPGCGFACGPSSVTFQLTSAEWNTILASSGPDVPVQITGSANVGAADCASPIAIVNVTYGSSDGDGDGVPNCSDSCPSVFNPSQEDADGDGRGDTCDLCPNDPAKFAPGICGCGAADSDSDGDSVVDCLDGCPNDSQKTTPGECGCGVSEADFDGDDVPDCVDDDDDDDGVLDEDDGCPRDYYKTSPGQCGCGVADTDSDADGFANCVDACPNDPNKSTPLGTAGNICGCGVPDIDSDADGAPNCIDGCPSDPLKQAPGACGCGSIDADSDSDGAADCVDGCPDDPLLTSAPTWYRDSDSDGAGDPLDSQSACAQPAGYVSQPGDGCPVDPLKQSPGICGCGIVDTDSDSDGTADCVDGCPDDPSKTAQFGAPGNRCGCGYPETDADGDGVPDCASVEGLEVAFDGLVDGRFVFSVYARSTNPSNGLLQVLFHEVVSGSMEAVLHSDAEADGSWNPNLTMPASAAADSFVTISGVSGDASQTLLDPKFNSAAGSVIPPRAGWFCANPLNPPTFAGGRIRIMQVAGGAGLSYCGKLSIGFKRVANQPGDALFAFDLSYCVQVDLSDADRDGVGAILDNCPAAFNPEQSDCDGDGQGDACEADPDCDSDGLSNACELSDGSERDCNGNGVPDSCDVASGTSQDIDSNSVPDECKADCNENGLPDAYEIATGQLADCDLDGVPDLCEVSSGAARDCDGDGELDSCEISSGEPDADSDGRPDRCEVEYGDFDLDGVVGGNELAVMLSVWATAGDPYGDLNGDWLVNGVDLGLILSRWGPVP
jgi:hypothetical protein